MSTEQTEQNLVRFREYLSLMARVGLDQNLYQKLDPSDIVQQTLLEAHAAWGQFRGKNDAELAGWLRKILSHNLANAARDYGRAKRDVRKEVSLQTVMDQSSSRLEQWLAADQSSPSRIADRNEQLIRISQALANIPEAQQEALTLRHLRGWSLDAISQRMGRSPSAVAGLLHRGLKEVRKVLQVS